MRIVIVISGVLAAVLPAAGYDLGTSRPAKPEAQVTPPPPDPALLRQGGDTILNAMPISLWWVEISGTTAGDANDYDEVCPYSGSTSPDVVYTFTPSVATAVTVDMYGSAYDTKIYIYDESLSLIACNDDFYPDYTSRLDNVAVQAGVQYYLVIDGYGGYYGSYYGNVFVPPVPPYLPCPDGAELEGEPEIVDGYLDAWNGGCNCPEFGNPFQPITQPVFCGRSGYYQSADGGSFRDTDWFHIVMPEWGELEITGRAEEATYMFELGPQDCSSVGVVQTVAIPAFNEATMTITGPGGALVWFWVGPQTFWSGNTYEYDYVLELNLPPVAVERHSWTAVKSLFE